MIKHILVLILLSSVTYYAQFEVEYNEIKGELTSTDKYESGFGRYDGYEIPLYENESVNFVVYTDSFFPKLVFVTPQGNVFRQTQLRNDGVASLITTVNESGNWLLYVLGDSTALGSYTLQYAFASSNSVSLHKDSDYCTILDYLTAHSKAYFLLLENITEVKSILKNLYTSSDAFLDEESGAFVLKIYEGNDLKYSDSLMDEITDKTSKCIEKSWHSSKENKKTVNDYKVRTNSFVENIKEKERFIRIELFDLTNSKEKFLGNYVLQIVIGRSG